MVLVESMTTPRMSYEEFTSKIKDVLEKNPEGLSWTEIRNRCNLYQKFPNNQWVHRMEKDIRLKREKVKGKVIWKI
jgi:hypothetical protein